MKTVLTVFGTRPELLKLAPVISALESRDSLRSVVVCTGQHDDLLRPFRQGLGVRVDEDLAVMQAGQTPAEVCARVLLALPPILERVDPDLVLVQGDTISTLAGAQAAFLSGRRVGHIEAGLRTREVDEPFPEEGARRMITRIATWHFAATEGNRRTLLGEGAPPERVFVCGNPGVDGLLRALSCLPPPSPELAGLLDRPRLVLLTTHRRESFGAPMLEHLRALRAFVEAHPEVTLAFPVHPNPRVREAARACLGGHPRIELLPPLGYADFLWLMRAAWLLVSDSGGVQEEAPTLGKPVIVLRAVTERPEVLACGVGRMAWGGAALTRVLEQAIADPSWAAQAASVANPFGDGLSGPRIVDRVVELLGR